MITTFTGPSGSGKGYVVKALKDVYGFDETPFYTTRLPRNGEKSDSRVFVDDRQFDLMLSEDELELVTCFHGARYGMSKKDMERMDSGRYVTEIHASNVGKFREMKPTANMVALVPRSMDILRKRMRGRGDTEESIRRRMSLADAEMEDMRRLEYLFDLVYHFDGTDEINVVDDIVEYVRCYNELLGRIRRTNLRRKELTMQHSR